MRDFAQFSQSVFTPLFVELFTGVDKLSLCKICPQKWIKSKGSKSINPLVVGLDEEKSGKGVCL